MDTEDTLEYEWDAGIVAHNEVLLEDIVERYEVTVFTLAMHLLSDEELAKKVVIDVFIRFSHEGHKHSEKPLDEVIHRFSYDAALQYLLGKIGSAVDTSVTIGNLLKQDDSEEVGYLC